MSHEANIARRASWLGKHGTVTLIEDETIQGYQHALSLEDVAASLKLLPEDDLRGLAAVILHQPSRKEDAAHPRWAAYFSDYSRNDIVGPTILLEAVRPEVPNRWPVSLGPEDVRELKLLVDEGHVIDRQERVVLISNDIHAVRNTQLRSLVHELGHHVDYMSNPASYASKGKNHKESFAIRYARHHADVLDGLRFARS
ncbi:MAG: hypothetical protein JWN89_42 [Parcubacteria group bacterium]|nr:hypothetical protein [Parcubacteria group bacterium]